jgi:glucose/arabinose dehydrogenase
VLPPEERQPIDRALVEYPAGFELHRYLAGLTAPSAIAFDKQRNALLVAESGADGNEPRIIGFNLEDGTSFPVYPKGRRLPFGLGGWKFALYAPIGGMSVRDGKIYVSHRDKNDLGVITALDYDGGHTTIVAGLPAQGDYGVTDVTVAPDGRIWFGVGSATNSGVVGLDNWAAGWVRDHPNVADRPYTDVVFTGYRMDTPNPMAAPLFGIGEKATTGPFQPFGVSNRSRIHGETSQTEDNKPNAAIYSVAPTGGIATDLRVEAHGIRLPRGLAFNEFGRAHVTNDGMELRGTRPVMDDPDALLRIPLSAAGAVPWFGWPDFTANLRPVTDEAFQPPPELIRGTGYPDRIGFLIDHRQSNKPFGLRDPTEDRDRNLVVAFPSLSGAAKLDFVPSSNEAFSRDFPGQAIVALNGDRAPFATSGRKLVGPVGYKVVRVDADSRQVFDFVRNTQRRPGSQLNGDPRLLERPIDAKFGPDGMLYILDYGQMEVRDGRERVRPRTGQIFRLAPPTPAAPPQTQPTTAAAAAE